MKKVIVIGTSLRKGTLVCGGVDAPRTIEGNAKLQEAYEMGKNC